METDSPAPTDPDLNTGGGAPAEHSVEVPAKQPYKPRHLKDIPPSSRRLPVMAASAVFLAVSIGGVTLHQVSAPVSSVEARSSASADPARTEPGKASRDRNRAQAAPDPAKPSAPPAPVVTADPAAPVAKELPYQFKWQENFYFCGPAATRIALTARNVFPSQSEVANNLGTTVNGTNSADNVTRSLNAFTGTSFYSSRFIPGGTATPAEIDRLRVDVVNAISKGYPVVTNIAGYTVDTDGATHSYPGGHYVTVVGYGDNGRTVKIADPADALGRGWYLLPTEKLAHWIARRGYSA